MTLFEPPKAWQNSVHMRVLQSDATAFAELCENALPYLAYYLQRSFPQYESSLQETVAIDCLLDYHAKAEQYDPKRISLYAYLRMAARRDMLNAIEKARRREGRLTDIDDPGVQRHVTLRDPIEEHIKLDEWLLEHTDLSLAEILKLLDAELDEQEKKVLMLMLEGVRESSRYTNILGVSQLDKASQQREVKRAKDRLMKKLQRFGQRIKRT